MTGSRINLAISLCLIGLLASCIQDSSNNYPIESSSQLPASPTALSPSATIISVTASPIAIPTTTESITSFEKRCPREAEVGIDELGLSQSDRLIVHRKNAPSDIAWSLVTPDGAIMDVSLLGGSISRSSVSPDRHWVAVGVFKQDSMDVWISSIDGSNLRLLIPDLPNYYVFDWETENALAFYESEAYIPCTDFLIDPFTSKQTDLPEICSDYGLYAFGPDATQVIYFSKIPGDSSWKRYDLTRDVHEKIAPWYDADRIEMPFFTWLDWTSEGIIFTFMNEDSLEVALLRPDQLDEVDASILTIKFDEISGSWGVTTLHKGTFLLFNRYSGVSLSDSIPLESYILDYKRNVLLDYCLEGDLYPALRLNSSNDRFLSWNSFRDDQKGTMILDLDSGHWSWLPGFELIGWGELAP